MPKDMRRTCRPPKAPLDLFSSVYDHRWLAHARVFSTISWTWVRTAPAPVSLASVCSRNGLLQSGSARMSGDVRRLTSVSIASVWAWSQGTFKRLVFLLWKRESRRRSQKGAKTEL